MQKILGCAAFFMLLMGFSCPAQSKLQPPIDQYVVEVFEDSKGNLWFGTLSKGVAKYDGKKLIYLSTADGLCGNAVVSIAEDRKGNLWFGTHSGLSRYDGKTFSNFTPKDGLCNERVSELLVDKKGTLWIGTWNGVCRYNGRTISPFTLPIPDLELLPYQNTMNWVTEIIQDRRGNIWFGRDGYGACKFDGTTFTHFTKKDGLVSNNIQVIREDKRGNLWFGSRVLERDNPDPKARSGNGGLSCYDWHKIIQFPNIKGLSTSDTYALYADKTGNVWIGANGLGLYRYDGQNFVLYSNTDRTDLMPYGYGIQHILEDSKKRLWLGLSGGLFRLMGSSIVHVAEAGPWQ